MIFIALLVIIKRSRFKAKPYQSKSKIKASLMQTLICQQINNSAIVQQNCPRTLNLRLAKEHLITTCQFFKIGCFMTMTCIFCNGVKFFYKSLIFQETLLSRHKLDVADFRAAYISY